MRFINQTTVENIRVAVGAVRSNLLRSSLTVMIIAVGIFALVGILSGIEAVKVKITQEFTRLGSNTFSLVRKNQNFRANSDGTQAKVYAAISYEDAMQFKSEFVSDSKVSVSANGAWAAIARFESNKTNPNIRVIGCDENYLDISGYDLASGRNFSENETFSGNSVAILGQDIVAKLFSEFMNPVDQVISIGNYKYTVIGVLKSKGNSMGFTGDNQILIPITNLKKNFATESTSYALNVAVSKQELLDIRIGDAIGLMRVIRGDSALSEESFEIVKSDSLVENFLEAISTVSIIATLIGIITLIAAGIGLMNIMLVSVTERTREIGVRKALGASQRTIRSQFLMEAIVIGQIGGALGILLGILAGNVTAMVIGAKLTMPWIPMFLGVSLCFIVSVISGYYPARQAASLDPIEALRHE